MSPPAPSSPRSSLYQAETGRTASGRTQVDERNNVVEAVQSQFEVPRTVVSAGCLNDRDEGTKPTQKTTIDLAQEEKKQRGSQMLSALSSLRQGPVSFSASALTADDQASSNLLTASAPNTPTTSRRQRARKSTLKAAGNAIVASQTFAHLVSSPPLLNGVIQHESPHGPPEIDTSAALTPAQALTRLTHTIFDRDADVPWVLRRPLVTFVSLGDKASALVEETLRPVFDKLVYWEAITASLAVSFSFIIVYFIGILRLSFAWVLLVGVLVGGSLRRSFLRMRDRVSTETTRKLALRRLEVDVETVEWVNLFLHRFWMQLEPTLSASLLASLNTSLGASKPGFLDSLHLSVFTLGSAAPRIETVRTIPRSADDLLLMEWDLNFTPVDHDLIGKREILLGDVRGSKIEIVARVGKGLASIPLPIVVSDLAFKGKMRLAIKFMSKHPHVKSVEYSFIETPKVDFTLRPLKALDIMDTPGLQTFLQDSINSTLSHYVEPQRQVFDVEGFFDGSNNDIVIGVLRITLYEARDLKNVELAGVSDPYVVVSINGKSVCKTSVVNGSLNPFWGETYFVPIMKSCLDGPASNLVSVGSDVLRMRVYDCNNTIADKFMGGTGGLRLGTWVRLLMESDASSAITTPIMSEAGSPHSPNGISRRAKEDLVSEWGSPFEGAGDVWKKLQVEEDATGTASSGPNSEPSAATADRSNEQSAKSGKASGGNLKGELRFQMTYFPFPGVGFGSAPAEPIKNDALSPATTTLVDGAMSAPDAIVSKTAESRPDEPPIDTTLGVAAVSSTATEAPPTPGPVSRPLTVSVPQTSIARIPTGVLTVTIHQARELPISKHAHPYCMLEVRNKQPPGPCGPDLSVGQTPVARRTNNPVWDYPLIFWVADAKTESLWFALKDSKEGNSVFAGVSVNIRDVIWRPSEETVHPDWFKLTSTTGKIRITFKWQPLDLAVAQPHRNLRLLRDPIGTIKIKLHSAKNLANVESFTRKSDPYAKLFLSKSVVGATHVKENTLDPVWNEVFFGVVYSMRETIRVELWDFNNLKRDRTLGRVEFTIEELLKSIETLIEGPRKNRHSGIDWDDESKPNEDDEIVIEPKREAWLKKNVVDGLRVKKMGDSIVDIVAPVYIFKTDDAEDAVSHGLAAANTKENQAAGPNTPAVTDSTTTLHLKNSPSHSTLASSITNLSILPGSSASTPNIRQKGFLHFELEFHGVVEDSVVRPKSQEELDELERKKLLAEAEVRRLKLLKNVGVLKDDVAEERVQLAEQAVKQMEWSPVRTLDSYPSGILRVRINRAKDLERKANAYMEILIDDETAFTTRTQRRTKSPIWDATGDILVKAIRRQQVHLQLRDSSKEDGTKNVKDDAVLGAWRGDIAALVGRKDIWLTMTGIDGIKEIASISINVGYVPIAASLTEDSAKNAGLLYVDIIDAINLEAIDSHSSDPYCVVLLNDNPIHRTKTQKRTLNPSFHETCSVAVASRLRSSLFIHVKHHASLARHTTLGTASFQLANLKVEELNVVVVPLEGARSGVIRFRLLFDHDASAANELGSARSLHLNRADRGIITSAVELDAVLSRVDKAEDGAVVKLTKGIGGVAVGTLASLATGTVVAGLPRQPQEGVMSAEMRARERGLAVREVTTRDLAPGGLNAKENADAVIGESARTLPRSPSEENTSEFAQVVEALARQLIHGSIKMTIVEARGLKPVDDGGTSDPYVKVCQTLHGRTKTLHKTKVIKKNLNPVWHHETFAFKVPPTTINIIVKDKNTFSESKALGEMDLDFNEFLRRSRRASARPAGEDSFNSDSVQTFDEWIPLGMGGTGDLHIVGEFRPDASDGAGSSASHGLAAVRKAATGSRTSLLDVRGANVEPEDGGGSGEAASPALSTSSSQISSPRTSPKVERRKNGGATVSIFGRK